MDYFILGEITNATLANFSEFISNNRAPFTINLNSGGGNIFSALAIYNLMKQRNNITVNIIGVCASAATLIAAGGKCKAAKNSLIMIHSPAVELADCYTAEELAKLQNSLEQIKNSMAEVYAMKTGKTADEFLPLLENETWLTAQQAKDFGLVDEITDYAADIHFDNSKKLLFVNSLAMQCNSFDLSKIEGALAQEVKPMAEKTNGNLMTKFKASILAAERGRDSALIALRNGDAYVNSIIDNAIISGETVENVKAQIEATSGRIAALNALRNDSPAVNSIINRAIENGDSVEKIRPYVNAIKEISVEKIRPYVNAIKEIPPQRGTDDFYNFLKDNLESGAENVQGSTPPPDEKAKDAAHADLIAKFINEMTGGAANVK